MKAGAILAIFLILLILLIMFYSPAISFIETQFNGNSSETIDVRSVEVNYSLENALNSYGNMGKGWTGSDGTYHITLPNGTVLWIFDDTFYRDMLPNGTRGDLSSLMRNSMVLEKNGTFYETLTSGVPVNNNLAYFPDPTQYQWYWPGPGEISGNRIEILLGLYSSYGSNPLDIKFQVTYLGIINESTLDLEKIILISNSQINWSQWVLHINNTTYIYGIGNGTSSMYVARVNGTDLEGNWSYYDGGGWSVDQSSAVSVFNRVAAGFSVASFDSEYILFTSNVSVPYGIFNGQIIGYISSNPVVNFTHGTTIYTAPQISKYQSCSVWTYGPHVQFSYSSEIILSYDVNTLNLSCQHNPSIYRPRFINIYLNISNSSNKLF